MSIFKRRKKKVFAQKMREVFHPPLGYRRAFWYWLHRLGRLNASPRSIAAGTACGASISFTPFIGFHLIGGWLMCLISGGNPLAMVIGSVIGNPWTFPLIWIGIYKLGVFLLGIDMTAEGAVAHLTLDALKHSPGHIFWPMTVGGVLIALLVWPITFYLVRPVVKRYQEKRQRRIANGKKLRLDFLNRVKGMPSLKADKSGEKK